MLRFILTALILPFLTSAQSNQEDPYLWLEEIQATQSLNWVQQQNSRTKAALTKNPRFEELKKIYLKVLTKVDFESLWRDDDNVYYLNTDTRHPRGRVVFVSRVDFNGDDTDWQTLIDIDELSKSDKKSYVFRSIRRLPHSSKALVELSIQGRDEIIVREFDLAKREFVKDGFEVPLSKTDVSWIDEDTLLLAYNEGPDSLTDSEYARRVRYWKRGSSLKDAELLVEFAKNTIGAGVGAIEIDNELHGLVIKTEENGDSATFILDKTTKKLTQWPVHPRASVLFEYQNKILFSLGEAWTIDGVTYAANSILGLSKNELDAGNIKTVTEIFKPNSTIFPQDIFRTKNKLIMTALSDAEPQLFEVLEESSSWKLKLIATPKGTTYRRNWSSSESDKIWFNTEGYASPEKLIEFDANISGSKTLQEKKLDFSLADIEVRTEWAISKDGTKVPYTIVALKQIPGKEMPRPTIQYGYGGFRLSEVPYFNEAQFLTWILRGGVYVHTKIRGGLEFGEEWHQQAIRENKQNVFDDFIAISEDLIQKKITTSDQLAIHGGSNGGLLVSAVAVQRPELYKAVVCAVPLIDMLRYHKLLAGSSWIKEYGDPDVPQDRAFLEKYSPYQNVKANVKMPKILFMTSTNDDRVHPGHARKMAAKMIDQGHDPLFYEETEGGHGGGVPLELRAVNKALVPEFLSQLLGLQTPVAASLNQYVRPSTNRPKASEYSGSKPKQKQEDCSKHLDNRSSKPKPSSKN